MFRPFTTGKKVLKSIMAFAFRTLIQNDVGDQAEQNMTFIANRSWDKTVTAYKGVNVDVHRNPSNADLKALFRAFSSLRSEIEAKSNDLLVWDASVATHGDIGNHYTFRSTFLYLYPDNVVANDIKYHTEKGGDQGYGSYLSEALGHLLSNEKLCRAYGGQLPPIIGVDNSNDERHELTEELLERIAKEMPDVISDICKTVPSP